MEMRTKRIYMTTILGLMANVETARGLTFSQIDSDLETDIFSALDSDNEALINQVIKRLGELYELQLKCGHGKFSGCLCDLRGLKV